MIQAYKDGKDLYATIAAGIYKNDYWDNMEHHEDGTPNPEGKKRRKKTKSLLLGIMYSMGAGALAESINSTRKEAQEIIDGFYNGFPNVKKWIDDTNKFAKENGFVEDTWGRRRRLPDILLPKYTIKYKDKNKNTSTTFNPLLGSLGLVEQDKSHIKKLESYTKKLEASHSRAETQKIIQSAANEGISIVDNGWFVAQAERQCVNARVQGSAATMSKKAMINVYHDKELNRLGFKLLIAVHDELIGECPEENAEAVADRLTEVMKSCAFPEVTVPFKCDPTIEYWWAQEDCESILVDTYKHLLAQGKSKEGAFSTLCEDRCEYTPEYLQEVVTNCN